MQTHDYQDVIDRAEAMEPGKVLKVGRIPNITVYRRYLTSAGLEPTRFSVYTVGGVCFIKRKRPQQARG